MYFFARLRIDLQISIFGFSHKLLVFRIYYREYVKSARYTPLNSCNGKFETLSFYLYSYLINTLVFLVCNILCKIYLHLGYKWDYGTHHVAIKLFLFYLLDPSENICLLCNYKTFYSDRF